MPNSSNPRSSFHVSCVGLYRCLTRSLFSATRDTFAKLPGGDTRLRSQQRRIADRISELNAVSQIKQDLDSTHLDGVPGGPRVKKEEEEDQAGTDVKVEDLEEGEQDEKKPERMQDVVANGRADEATSPSAKRRIAAQLLVRPAEQVLAVIAPLTLTVFAPRQARSPQSLTAGMTLAESIEIQQRAAERERREAERKAARMQVDAKRPTKTGELLRGALGVDSALSGYMSVPSLASPWLVRDRSSQRCSAVNRFAADSDDSLDEADIDDYLNEGRKGANGELDAEEDSQLNPLRTAYMEGWTAAEREG